MGMGIGIGLKPTLGMGVGGGDEATEPAQFGSGDWSVADRYTGGDIRITITALPDDGGSAITDLEYQIEGGSWVSLAGTTTGAYDISGLTDDVEVDVAIRAVNAVGNGTASATKAVTPTSAVLALDFVNNRYVRNGVEILSSDFVVVGGTFKQSASGLQVVTGDIIYLDASACDLENPGTVVWDGTPGASADTNARLWSLTNGGALGNDYTFGGLFGANVNARLRAAAGSVISPSNTAYTLGNPLRHAISWDATDLRHSTNGGASVTALTGAAPSTNTLNRLYLGNGFAGGTPIAGYIRSIFAYRTKSL